LSFSIKLCARWMMIAKSLPEIASIPLLLFDVEALPRAVVPTRAARSDE
jgi:hypothetical protein